MDVQTRAPQSWGVEGVRLTPREISTAASVARHCGSIFSRKDSSNLLDSVEEAFEFRIQGLPPWLRNVQLKRSATIHLAGMRRVKVDKIMDEMNMFKLSGLAAFVVVCSRYSDGIDTIITMLELLIQGELSPAVVGRKSDDGNPTAAPFKFTHHLRLFVASFLDADRGSDVSQKVLSWIAKLQAFGGLTWAPDENFVRTQQSSIDIMRKLLGVSSSLTDNNPLGERHNKPLGNSPDQYADIYDTLHVTNAYVALGAAAHGADVVVECISQSGHLMIPEPPSKSQSKSSVLLVRLWLRQPPEDLYGVMKSRKGPSVTNFDTIEEGKPTEPFIVGGSLELAAGVARRLGFKPPMDERNVSELLLSLWRRGAAYGKTLKWLYCKRKSRTSTRDYHPLKDTDVNDPDVKVSFILGPPNNELTIRPEAKQLLSGLLVVAALPILTDITNIIDDLYDIKANVSGRQDEMVKAGWIIMAAICVQILENLIHPASDVLGSYALDSALCVGGYMDRENLVAILEDCFRGVPPSYLVAVAALVFGGISIRSASLEDALNEYTNEDMSLAGIVAPHCTVILETVRDPLAMIRGESIRYPLSIWRGAMPALPRDPVTNFLIGDGNRQRERSSKADLSSRYAPSTRTEAKGPMLVTFEPYGPMATRGSLCFWYAGYLVLEANPHDVLQGVMKSIIKKSIPDTEPERLLELSREDLLSMRSMRVMDDSIFIVRDAGNPAWLLLTCTIAVSPTIIVFSCKTGAVLYGPPTLASLGDDERGVLIFQESSDEEEKPADEEEESADEEEQSMGEEEQSMSEEDRASLYIDMIRIRRRYRDWG